MNDLQVTERDQGNLAGNMQAFASMLAGEMHRQQPRMIDDDATNAQIIALWMHGKSQKTRIVYEKDIMKFMDFVGHKHLGEIRLHELQAFKDELEDSGLSIASQARIISAVKSLFTKACKLGAIPFNIGAQVEAPRGKEQLAERILSEEEVLKMLLSVEDKPKEYAIVRTFYVSGCRVSELQGIKWKDIKEREQGAQITVLGKGNRTRAVLIDQKTYECLLKISEERDPEDHVFKSQKGTHFTIQSLSRIVRNAAKKAGLPYKVSCHWLRHCNASHALDNGAPIHLVQQTLGHASLATTSRYVHAKPTESTSKYLKL